MFQIDFEVNFGCKANQKKFSPIILSMAPIIFCEKLLNG